MNKTEKYDLKIFEHLVNQAEKEKTSLNDFLRNTKPFSKWDIRPFEYDKVWALDSLRTSSEIPNFFWGGFSANYNLSPEEAMNKPNEFLLSGNLTKIDNINYLEENIEKFKRLSLLISENKDLIYLNQNSIQRVGDLYKENNIYWNYVIPKSSPFPISEEVKINGKIKFSKKQEEILSLIKDVNIYACVKTSKGIFYLIDGFTDNSYGFYYNSKNEMETDNFLFETVDTEKIKDNFFYYIAN